MTSLPIFKLSSSSAYLGKLLFESLSLKRVIVLSDRQTEPGFFLGYLKSQNLNNFPNYVAKFGLQIVVKFTHVVNFTQFQFPYVNSTNENFHYNFQIYQLLTGPSMTLILAATIFYFGVEIYHHYKAESSQVSLTTIAENIYNAIITRGK